MQNDGKLPPDQRRNYKHVFDALLRISREDGPTGLFRGVTAHVARSGIVTVSQLVSYDYAKEGLIGLLGMQGAAVSTHVASSMIAAGVATTAAHPVDLIKSRIMSASTKQGVLAMAAKVVREEGPRALFKGWLSAYIRMGPHLVLIFGGFWGVLGVRMLCANDAC